MERTIESGDLQSLQTQLNDAMFEAEWYMQGDIYFQGGLFKIRLFRLPPSAVETALLALDEPPESPTFLPHLSSLLVSAARAPLRLPAIAASAAARLGDTGLFDRLRGGDYDVFVPLFENLSGAPRDNPRELARISVLLDYFSGESGDPTLWEYAQEQWETLARGLDMSDDLAAARRWLQQVVRPKEKPEALVREKIDEVQPAVAALAAAAAAVQETADAAAQFSAFDGKLAQVRDQLTDPKVKIYKNTVDVERKADALKAISAAIMRILEEAKAAALEKQKEDITQKNQATRIQRAAKRSLENRRNAVPVNELAAAAIDPTLAEQAKTEAQTQAFVDWVAEANDQARAIGATKNAAERVAAEAVRAAQQEAQAAADARAAEAQAATQAAAAEALTATALEVAAAAAKLEGNETAVKEAAAEAKEEEAEEAEGAESAAINDATGDVDDAQADAEQVADNLAQAKQTTAEALAAAAEAKAAADAQAAEEARTAETRAVAEAKTAEAMQLTAALAANEEDAKVAEREAQTAADALQAAAIINNAEAAAAADAETAETLQLELAANEAAAKQAADEAERLQAEEIEKQPAIADQAVAEAKEAEEAVQAAMENTAAQANDAQEAAAQQLAVRDAAAQQAAQASIKQVETDASALKRILLEVVGRSKYAAERVRSKEQEALEKEKVTKIKAAEEEAKKAREAAKAREDRKAAEEARTAAEKGVAGKAVSFSKKQAREVEDYARAADGLAKEAAEAALAQATPDLNEILTNFIISVDVIKTIVFILSDGSVNETTTKIIEAERTALELLKDTEPVPIHFIKTDALSRSQLLQERTRAIMQGQIPYDVLAKIQTKFQELTEASTLDEIQKAEVEIAVELATIVRSMGAETGKMDILAKDYLTRWLLTNDRANERILHFLDEVKAKQEAERDDSEADAFEPQEAEIPVKARSAEEMAALERFNDLNPEEIYVAGEGVEGGYTRAMGDPLVLTYTHQKDRTITINMIKEGDKYTFKMQFGNEKLYPTNVDSDAQWVSVLDIERYEKPGWLFKSQIPVAIYDDTEEKHPSELVFTSATPDFNGIFVKNENRYTGVDGLEIKISKNKGQMQYAVDGFNPVDRLFGDVAFVDESDPLKQAEVRIQTVAEAIEEAMQAAEMAAQEGERNAGELVAVQETVEQISAAAQEETRAAAEARATAEAEAFSAAENAVQEGQRTAAELQEKQLSVQQVGADARAAFEAKVRAADAAEQEASAKARAAAAVVAEKRNNDAMGQAKASTAGFAVSRVEAAAAEVANQAGVAAQVEQASERAAHFAGKDHKKTGFDFDDPLRFEAKSATKVAARLQNREAASSAENEIRSVTDQTASLDAVLAKVEETTAAATAAAAEVAEREAARIAEVARAEAAQLQQETARIKEVERKEAAVAAKKLNYKSMPDPVTPLVLLSNIPEINGLYTITSDEEYPILYKNARGKTISYDDDRRGFNIDSKFFIPGHEVTGNLLNHYRDRGNRLTIANFIPELRLSLWSDPLSPIQGMYTSTDGLLYKSEQNSFEYDAQINCFTISIPSLAFGKIQYTSTEKVHPGNDLKIVYGTPQHPLLIPEFGQKYTDGRQSINVRFQMPVDDAGAALPAAAQPAAQPTRFSLSNPANKEIQFYSKINGTTTKNLIDVVVGDYSRTSAGYNKDQGALPTPVTFKQEGAGFKTVVQLKGSLKQIFYVTYILSNINGNEAILTIDYMEGDRRRTDTANIQIIFQ